MKPNTTTSEKIQKILKSAKTIAVVGISNNPDKASYRVALYLKNAGYTIIPVNPTIKEWCGLPSYPNLNAVPEAVDIVDIFRRPEDVPAIVDEAIANHAKVVWMQLEIINEVAAAKAKSAGLQVVMDRCTKVEHYHLPKQGTT